MTPDDPLLMAYADGELAGDEAARVEAAIAADARLGAVVLAHQALRRQLRDAYAPGLDEAVPARLREVAARGAGDRLLPLHPPQVRAQPTQRRRSARARLALAATLVFGIALGLVLGRTEPSPFGLDAQGRWVAQGELAQALGRQLAADSDGKVGIGLSFRDDRGQWCRSFHFQHETPLAGLACRNRDAWQLVVLAESEATGGELSRAAAATPPTVLAAIDARLAGDPLDAGQERAARDAGWP